ncbi:MAG: T9SS type B sorting domain-containing protein, partial [Nonlabens ulvanivorans]|uniref:T9SS type B sorting domain-containing protein n=2 Tax=Nonlabens TaxID=363408 RepID=UPI003263575C
ILPAPVSGTPIDIIICDNDQDGFSVIDITSQESQITTDANRAITYHHNFSDAEIGVNPINNSTGYNAQTETIFVRVENLNNGCETVVQQSIIVNTLPVFTNITTYQLCEADGNEIEDFFLSTKDNEILNGQTGKSTSYYRSFTEADTSTNSINKLNAFQNTSNPQTIWVRVENDSDPSCYGVDSFLLQVDESPVYNVPADLRICDDNNDGISTFDLQQSIDMIRSGISTNLTVSFHESALQANLNNHPLPLVFTNTINPQTIYARIGNDVSCYEVEEILFNVIDSPLTNTVTPSISCDMDQDGSTSFDLTSREAELVGTRPFNSTLSWHTSIIDAQNDVNPISNETDFINTTNPQTVYLRFYNTVSRCYDVGNLELIVNLPLQLNPVNDLLVCDNPIQTANLNEVVPQFIDPLPAGFSTSFYRTNLDAINQTNELNSNFNYTANNTTIFIRLENTVSGCFSISNFNLKIQAAPQIATPGSYELRSCDTDFDDQHSFDLSTNNSIILNGLDPSMHTIQYFTSLLDAEDDINPLTNHTVSVTVQDTYYVRVTNIALGCFSVGEFEVIVDSLPIVLVDLEYVICNNGFVTVDAFSETSGESYLWSTGEVSSSIDINEPGSYSVQVTSSQGCVFNPINFTVFASQTPAVEFITSTNFGDPNTITVTVNGTGDYQYVLDNGVPQNSNVFVDVSRGYHEVRVIDLNGCAPSPPQQVLIIDYPRFFTPNNDGFNDTWYVDQINTFDSATFSIFDRYGKLLKSYDKDHNGWDGLYNGSPMPSSDYWFLLEIKDSRGDMEIKGHFSLKR